MSTEIFGTNVTYFSVTQTSFSSGIACTEHLMNNISLDFLLPLHLVTKTQLFLFFPLYSCTFGIQWLLCTRVLSPLSNGTVPLSLCHLSLSFQTSYLLSCVNLLFLTTAYSTSPPWLFPNPTISLKVLLLTLQTHIQEAQSRHWDFVTWQSSQNTGIFLSPSFSSVYWICCCFSFSLSFSLISSSMLWYVRLSPLIGDFGTVFQYKPIYLTGNLCLCFDLIHLTLPLQLCFHTGPAHPVL